MVPTTARCWSGLELEPTPLYMETQCSTDWNNKLPALSIILKRRMILIELTPKSLPIRFIHWRDSKPIPLPKSLMFFRSAATIQSANDWKISQSTSNGVLQIQITSYILVTFSTIAKFWGIHNVTSKREHLNDLYFWLMWLKCVFLHGDVKV